MQKYSFNEMAACNYSKVILFHLLKSTYYKAPGLHNISFSQHTSL